MKSNYSNHIEMMILNWKFLFQLYSYCPKNKQKILLDEKVELEFIKTGTFQYSMQLKGKNKQLTIKMNTKLQAFVLCDIENQFQQQFLIPESENTYYLLEPFDKQSKRDYEDIREIYCRLAFQQEYKETSENLEDNKLTEKLFCFMKVDAQDFNAKILEFNKKLKRQGHPLVSCGTFFKRNIKE